MMNFASTFNHEDKKTNKTIQNGGGKAARGTGGS